MVALEELVPVRAPDHLDYVPASAAEDALELVDDALVAAHRPVEPLQVAVHHKDQVVQLFARRHADSAERIHFIRLAIAYKRPDLSWSLLDQLPILEIPHEPRLVDRIQRSAPHRHCRKPPEVRHQPGVRIRRKPRLAPQLMAKMQQPLIVEPPQQVGPRINTRRSVPLEINEIARLIAIRSVEKVIESHFKQRGQRRVSGKMSADPRILLVLP